MYTLKKVQLGPIFFNKFETLGTLEFIDNLTDFLFGCILLFLLSL